MIDQSDIYAALEPQNSTICIHFAARDVSAVYIIQCYVCLAGFYTLHNLI